MGHLRTVLEAMAADPKRRLIDVPLLTVGEQELLLSRWNGSDNGVRSSDVDAERLSEEEIDALLCRLSSTTREER
jgi:hypothetical protein